MHVFESDTYVYFTNLICEGGESGIDIWYI